MTHSVPTRRSSDLADIVVAAIFIGKAQPRADGHLRTDDAMAAIESLLDTEHVHRAALAFGITAFAPGQFRHDALGVHATSKHMAMVAIRSEDHTSELQSLMRISYAVLCLKH